MSAKVARHQVKDRYLISEQGISALNRGENQFKQINL